MMPLFKLGPFSNNYMPYLFMCPFVFTNSLLGAKINNLDTRRICFPCPARHFPCMNIPKITRGRGQRNEREVFFFNNHTFQRLKLQEGFALALLEYFFWFLEITALEGLCNIDSWERGKRNIHMSPRCPFGGFSGSSLWLNNDLLSQI